MHPGRQSPPVLKEEISVVDMAPQTLPPHAMMTRHNVTSTINPLICHISSGDTDTSNKAKKEIEEILRQRNKVEVMSGHINKFLVANFQSVKFINQWQEEDKK
ncbi:hypothetical protein DUI87_21239 [Hirundo rustica rustica]|uniref:Uncharacterized protein n=1 Tax=Hirundo rustica rustica TaxID=333673 RepID=A0A3M0K4T4_HIRRU|nr:hypothetical protein DUI87_21239 [Hirundo rustica rustica]